MHALDSLKKLAGRALKPIRAGESKNAAPELGASRTVRVRAGLFADGHPIPLEHAGEHGRAPSISWSSVPPQAIELVLLVEDPDAPMTSPFVHWIVAGIPPQVTALSQMNELVEGRNGARSIGWTGPKPPPGHGVHHYHFQIFALDAPTGATRGISREELVPRMRGHVLGYGEIVGTFERT